MSLQVMNYTFEGPYASANDLKEMSGVYLIVGNNGGDRWNVVDVGESGGVKSRVGNHDRAMCWRGLNYTNLQVAVLYANENQRMAIEQQLRQNFNPPCGER